MVIKENIRKKGIMLATIVFFLVIVLFILQGRFLLDMVTNSQYEELESTLNNLEECYLCGNSARSLVSYYRKVGSLGIIDLNKWIVLDLGLEVNDDNLGANRKIGNIQGVKYCIESNPSENESSIKISAGEEFDSKIMENNLCSICLTKVVNALEENDYSGKKDVRSSFLFIDFETLELYPLRKGHESVSIKNCIIEIEIE